MTEYQRTKTRDEKKRKDKIAQFLAKQVGSSRNGEGILGNNAITGYPTAQPMETENTMDSAIETDATPNETPVKTKKEKAPSVPVARPNATDLTLEALHGKMSDFDYFVATMTIGDVVNRLHYGENDYDAKETPADEQYQRKLNKSRVKTGLVPYLQSADHFLPPIVAYLNDGEYTYDKSIMILSKDAICPVGDGQHRLYGLQLTVEDNPDDLDFQAETIGVVFIPNLTVDQRQQLFSDLNRNAKLPPKAIGVLYDHRDICAVITRLVADSGYLSGKVKMESNTLSKADDQIVTLGVLYEMVKSLIMTNPDSKTAGGLILKDQFKGQEAQAIADWVAEVVNLTIFKNLPSSDPIIKGVKGAAKIGREAYLCYSSLGWQAMGRTVAEALDWGVPVETVGQKLAAINWSLNAPVWAEGGANAPVNGGKVVTRRNNINQAILTLRNILSPKNTTATN